MVVQLTVGELEALLTRAVAAGIAQMQPETLEYLTLAQVAKMLDVDERTVTTYIKRDALPATKLGHEWRFASKEVAAWVAERRFKKKAG